ncbi:rhodanese-like domain-containing protein [Gammaproteobacteria bacterium]|nr:rhodanese-like domain-containing protein [Gammaproteobacteria bacterium]
MKSILLTLMVFSGLIVFADDKNEASQSFNPILIDVRTHAEWDDGHIETAIHIPLDKISNTIEGFIEDKDQVIYLYCRSGNRSGQAEMALKSIGYVNAKNVGGIKQASTNLRLKILKD